MSNIITMNRIHFVKFFICSLALSLTIQTGTAQSDWKARLIKYITSLAKSNGGYGWEDQPDAHLTPTFAVVGILHDINKLPDEKERTALVHFIKTHHPQYGGKAIQALLYKDANHVTYLGPEWKNGEAGSSGSAMRDLIYQQIQAILWLGGDAQDYDTLVGIWKTQAGNIANYEKHNYPVLFQEMMTPVCRYLLKIKLTDANQTIAYMESRRRKNGSFNNAPASDGGDGNMLNTYWSLYALHILGKENILQDETIHWLQSSQLKNGGFTHQPSPEIGGSDDVAYTWAAVKALQLLSAKPVNIESCIHYLLSLRNNDGGFGNRPGLPSTPMSTYYAIDALKTLDAFSYLDKSGPVKDQRSEKDNNFSGLNIYTVQFEAPGAGSPQEAVMLADSLHIHLWGCKNGPEGWIDTAQEMADKRHVPVTFFVADEPYGKYVHIDGMGSFGHILDFMAPAHLGLPEVGDDPSWQQYHKNYILPLLNGNGALLLQVSNNEPLARIILDESIKHGGFQAISTIHFDQNFLFWLPYLYQYRYQLPFVALQDAHGSEGWWWTDELVGYRTLFLAKEPTYKAMMEALKKNWVVAVRHDSLSKYKTRILGGAPGIQKYILSHQEEWKWWGNDTDEMLRPWAAISLITPSDSFEITRPEKGLNVRIRCWWRSSRPILKSPVVELNSLEIDGGPVKPSYVIKRNKQGKITDSYYLFNIPNPSIGAHVIKASLTNVINHKNKIITKNFSLSDSNHFIAIEEN